MIDTETIFRQLQMNCIGGVKVPHLMSLPVISNSDGKYEMAVFLVFFTAEDICLNRIVAPSKIIYADLESGEISHAQNFRKERRLTDSTNSNSYTELEKRPDLGKSYLRELFFVFDDVKQRLLDTGKIDIDRYCHYLSGILDTVPLPPLSPFRIRKRLRIYFVSLTRKVHEMPCEKLSRTFRVDSLHIRFAFRICLRDRSISSLFHSDLYGAWQSVSGVSCRCEVQFIASTPHIT